MDFDKLDFVENNLKVALITVNIRYCTYMLKHIKSIKILF